MRTFFILAMLWAHDALTKPRQPDVVEQEIEKHLKAPREGGKALPASGEIVHTVVVKKAVDMTTSVHTPPQNTSPTLKKHVSRALSSVGTSDKVRRRKGTFHPAHVHAITAQTPQKKEKNQKKKEERKPIDQALKTLYPFTKDQQTEESSDAPQ